MQALPIMAGLLGMAFSRQQLAGGDGWGDFLAFLGMKVAAALPLFAAHMAACRLSARRAALWWLAIFGLYPFAASLVGAGSAALTPGEWALLSALSIVGLLTGRRDEGSFIHNLRRLPVTLDGTVSALLGLWVVAVSLLFISTPDPVNNQPLRIWFDGARITGNPGLFLGYLLQFSLTAALLFAYYAACRYLLVRRILRDEGVAAFLLASFAFWVVATPAIGSLIILLPLNEPHWAILPSEVPDPFAAANYGFSLAIWAIACPIALVSERLLQEQRAAMSRHERVRAELVLLQQQINPHFLFNTLNTLYALCLRDSRESAQAVVKLSDLLRYSVYEGCEEWVALDGEIGHLNNYLDLQTLRFGKRCAVSAHWPGDTADFLIPPQMLILLVENAFKHGIEPSDRPSALDIALHIDGRRIRFICLNSPVVGIGGDAAGVGLANLRRRLQLVCGDDFRLSSQASGDGWRAELELELRRC